MHDWAAICRRYGPLVWSIVYRILKDRSESLDCYQDVLLEAFQETREQKVENWAALLRWLAVRRAIDRLRKRQRRDEHVEAAFDLALLETSSPGPVDEAMMREFVERVRGELAKLPEHQAESFWLRCVEQMSYDEIAEQVGLDTNAVGVLIHRAKLRLRKLLADLNPNLVQESTHGQHA